MKKPKRKPVKKDELFYTRRTLARLLKSYINLVEFTYLFMQVTE